MLKVTTQKEREACSFIGRKGLTYVKNNATEEEKRYFEGILYKKGKPTLINNFIPKTPVPNLY